MNALSGSAKHLMGVNLKAIVVTMADGNPAILRISGTGDVVADMLPSASFNPGEHHTLEAGLRQLMVEQTGMRLDEYQQVYAAVGKNRDISIGYLALTTTDSANNSLLAKTGARWKNWYAFLPWEDWRTGRPAMLDEAIIPALQHWASAEDANENGTNLAPVSGRIAQAFGVADNAWETDQVGKRYDLMLEAGLLAEKLNAGHRRYSGIPLGNAMARGQRQMLATAIGMIRRNFKYKPVAQQLMVRGILP